MHVPFGAFDVDGGGVARGGAHLGSDGGAHLWVEEVSNQEEPGGGRRVQYPHTLNSRRFRQPYVRRHEMARLTARPRNPSPRAGRFVDSGASNGPGETLGPKVKGRLWRKSPKLGVDFRPELTSPGIH